MKRHIVIFVVTFLAGALVAFAMRTVMHEPHATAAVSAPEMRPQSVMVNNALKPAVGKPSDGAQHARHTAVPAAAAANVSEQHDHGATETSKPASEVVNTRCAICGMPVDPSLPTGEYEGKKIGFGCRMCPPKFKADPDKYGPYYLRNEVIKR